jgi:HEPN domain-containing protein
VAAKSKAQLAREHLERALPAVAAGDYTEVVAWLFVSLEAAIAAVAARHGLEVEPKHWQKLDVAEQLQAEGRLGGDVAATLRTLNEARKQALYEGEEPDLDGKSLDELAAAVESAVEQAEGAGDG